MLQKISNEDDDDDSSDNEGAEQIYQSDDSDELEFESDEEGNYASKWDDGVESENSADEEAESEDEDEINESDIEDISDEGEDDIDEVSDEESNSKVTDLLKNRKPDRNIPKKGLESSTSASAEKELKAQKVKTNQVLKDFKEELKDSNLEPVVQAKKEEYEDSDTSDEEDIRNTVGNIPMHWYDEYKHIGYDWDAKKIVKPSKGDQIDDFLRKIEDPDFWRSVKDPQTGQEVVLTDADIELIKRINSSRVPNPEHNEYEPWIEWFTSEVERMPIKNVPDHKRSFLPSSSERKKVSRMIHALKMGWMKTMEEVEREKKAARGPKFYMLWETDTSREQMRRIHDPVSAPKRDLPGHAESYNPPTEYLFDEREQKEWLKLKDEPHKRKLHFMPQKYKSLREVPAYPRFIRERFMRCLDLYLCPRARRTKLNIDAEYLIPKLPSPKDLQPFPTVESLVYRGHTDLVRTVSVEAKGEYIVSGSDDKTVKS